MATDVALVTASSGIGAALARRIAREHGLVNRVTGAFMKTRVA